MLGCLHRSKPLLVVEAATALIFVFWMLVSTSDCDENSFLSPILPCTSTPELRLDIAQASSKLPTAAICSTTLSTTSPPPHGEAARPLSPHELLCRSRSVNHTEVPRLLHQSWKTSELPQRFQQWSESCRQHHQGWEWVLWTDEDNFRLVQTYFPELEETYRALPHNIYRADLARNLYMYLFGGVYTDLDMECLQSAASVLQQDTLDQYEIHTPTQPDLANRSLAVFGRMGQDLGFKHSIPNAWMAATPGHPLFLLPLQNAYRTVMKRRSSLYRMLHPWPGAEALTGPIMLQRSIAAYSAGDEDSERVVLLPNKYIYPYDWKHDKQYWHDCSAQSAQFNSTACKKLLDVEGKESIAITYWSHSWG